MRYFIGIDSSTTATKALLMTQDGTVVGVSSAEYAYETPHPLWSEQEPGLWWDATCNSIRSVIAEAGITPTEVSGIGLTGQMHGLVLLDAAGESLRPAILWNDQRTQAECDEIRAIVGKQRLIDITGNDALTGFTAPKILWVKNHEPTIYAQIAQILLPKDYVRFKLTGQYATDKAGAAGTQLFDVRTRNWSTELLDALGIALAWMPPTFEGTAVTGLISAEAAAQCGLAIGTPVFGGGGDQAANAVGTGAVVDGVVALSLGTSGVVFASSDEPLIEADGRLHAFCHAVPNKWHFMGVMLSAAGSLRWYHDTFCPDMSYDEMTAEAAEIPAGSDGLLFLPYLTGERTPHPDPLARGAFVGFTVRHTRAHATRAVMEGVAYGFRDMFELMREAGLADVTQIRASGGGTRSKLWLQILADVLQKEIVTVNTTEGAAFGAAILAAVGTGVFADVPAACAALIEVADGVSVGGNSAEYQQRYPIYTSLYPNLRTVFSQLN